MAEHTADIQDETNSFYQSNNILPPQSVIEQRSVGYENFQPSYSANEQSSTTYSNIMPPHSVIEQSILENQNSQLSQSATGQRTMKTCNAVSAPEYNISVRTSENCRTLPVCENSISIPTSENYRMLPASENNSVVVTSPNTTAVVNTGCISADKGSTFTLIQVENRTPLVPADCHTNENKIPANISTVDPYTENRTNSATDGTTSKDQEDAAAQPDMNDVNQPDMNDVNKASGDPVCEDNTTKADACICANEKSSEPVEIFKCAECSKSFSSICCLHRHVKEHVIGGSYFFDHISQTAFPKQPSDNMDKYKSSQGQNNTGKYGTRSRSKKSLQHIADEQDLDDVDTSTVQSKPKRKRKNRRKNKPVPRCNEEEDFHSGIEDPIKDLKIEINYHTDGDEVSDGETFYIDVNKIQSEINQDNRPLKKRKIAKRPLEATKTNSKRGRPPSKAKNVNNVLEGCEASTELQGESNENIENMNGSDKQQNGNIAKPSKPVKPPKPPKEEKPKGLRKCETCGQSVSLRRWDIHQMEHTGERPFVCEKCGKNFARNRFLSKHLITHEEVKPWRCTICPAQFCQGTEYRTHMAVHEGNRPHVCNVCDKRFFTQKSLHTHQANVHMGLTHFECEVCNRRFFKKSSLNVHCATHYEPKMQCSFCNKKFRDKTGLQRHERTHTGVKKFQCHICKHGFIQSTPFWLHMEKRHGVCRTKLKEKLEAVKETNRRLGKPTDILVLPDDQDDADIQETYKRPEKKGGKTAVNPNSDPDGSQPYEIGIEIAMPSNVASDEPSTNPGPLTAHLMRQLYPDVNTEMNSKQPMEEVHYYTKEFKPAVLSTLLSAGYAVSLSQEQPISVAEVLKPVNLPAISLLDPSNYAYADLTSQPPTSDLALAYNKSIVDRGLDKGE